MAPAKMSVRSLESEMENMTSSRFGKFKLFIRQKAEPFRHIPFSELKLTSEWIIFRQTVLENFPELQQYDDQWPVDAYYKLCIKNLRQSPCNSNKIATSQQSSARRTFSDVASSAPKRTRTFVGKTPPPNSPRHCARGKENDMSDHNNILLTINRPRQIPNGYFSVPMSSTQIPTSANSCDTPPRPYPPFTYPVSCLQCGHLPPIPSAANHEISAVLRGKNSMISALAGLGIVSDHHLDGFRKWGTLLFFNSVPLRVLDPLHRAVLIKYLRLDGSTQHQSKDDLPNSSINLFRLPSTDLEKHLTNPNTRASALQEAMGLGDDLEAFNTIIKTIEETMKDELPTPEVGDTGQHELQGKAFTHKICLKCPQLKKYQNSWPITIYIKWRRQRLCSQRLPTTSQREVHVVDPTSNVDDTWSLCQRQHMQGNRSPLETPFSGCPTHRLPNSAEACPKLLKLLCSFGMQELLAVFLALGIKSNEDFDLFYDLDMEDRISMCENLTPFNLKLNQFQEMMLRKMIEHRNV